MREKHKGVGFQYGGSQPLNGGQRRNHFNSSITTFFFTRFPKGTLDSDLWQAFARFGNVDEVVVPRKLDKWGRAFGFVRFRDVGVVEDMERKLGEVWVGDCRLMVNMAKFSKEEQQGEVVPKQVGGSIGHVVQQGRSFRNVLTNI